MYIRKSTRKYKGKTYTNYLFVESVHTPKGPGQRSICSLGNLAPAAAEEWLALAHRLESALRGQLPLDASDAKFEAVLESARRRSAKRRGSRPPAGAMVKVDTDRVEVEEARQAGPVHVGHQMWERLGLVSDLMRMDSVGRCNFVYRPLTFDRFHRHFCLECSIIPLPLFLHRSSPPRR